MVPELRITVRFHKTGGSRTVIISKEFLDASGFGDAEVESVLVRDGILLTPKHVESPLDEPMCLKFLDFLEKAAQRVPGRLRNVLDLMAEDADLFDGVVIDGGVRPLGFPRRGSSRNRRGQDS